MTAPSAPTIHVNNMASGAATALRDSWVVAFNTRTLDPSGRRTPSGTLPHWQQPLARIRHRGRCQGILGSVLRLQDVDVLGLHGRGGRYERFRLLRVVDPGVDASVARSASDSSTVAACARCGNAVDLRPLDPHLRRLPFDLPDRPINFHL